MKTIMYSHRGIVLLFVTIAFLANSHIAVAKEKIAVLDFELNNITSLPNTPDELARTASIKPLLERAISESTEFKIIHFDLKEQKAANAGLVISSVSLMKQRN